MFLNKKIDLYKVCIGILYIIQLITTTEFGALALYIVALISIVTNVFTLAKLINEPKHNFPINKEKKIYQDSFPLEYSHVINIPQC